VHLTNDPAEVAFLATFDFAFPYGDAAAATALIEQGWAISLNAACCVLNELCRSPHADVTTKERQLALIDEWSKAGPAHPLKRDILRCARALATDQVVPLEYGLTVMRDVSFHEGQRAALAIAYFATDLSQDDSDRLTHFEADVRASWDQAGV
jgi:hypothetical protein